MTLFLRFRRATLLLTRGMPGSLRHQQALEASLVGVRHQRGFAEVALPLGMLLGQDVALVRVIAAQAPAAGQPHAFPERTFGFLLGHLVLPGLAPGVSCHFGASTIDMLRPSSFGSCSILATSLSSVATRSSTSRPRSMWAICRPRYIIVTFTLLPSCRNSRAWRVLNAKSWSSMPGRYFTSFKWMTWCFRSPGAVLLLDEKTKKRIPAFPESALHHPCPSCAPACPGHARRTTKDAPSNPRALSPARERRRVRRTRRPLTELSRLT